MKIVKRLLLALALTTITLPAFAAELKLATLAPQGTTLYNSLKAAADEITAKTGGKVTVKLFGGGVQGDEKDVVRKMRYGQLAGAALTGNGLGLIEPEIRVLELPFLFEDNTQVDNVYAGMKDYFKLAFDKKGYVLLGWAEVGFVKIFSNKPIAKRSDLKGMKMWMWEGDELAKAMYEAMGVTPVPLAITDVLTSLQTNLIDGVYNTELGAIGFQWQTKVSNITDLNLVNGTGAILLAKPEWNKLGASEKAVVQQVIEQTSAKLVQQTRADNVASKTSLTQNGVNLVTPDAADVVELRKIGLDVRQKLVGKLYSQQTLDKVLSLLK